MDLIFDITLAILLTAMVAMIIAGTVVLFFGIGTLIYDDWLDNRIKQKEKEARLKKLKEAKEKRPW